MSLINNIRNYLLYQKVKKQISAKQRTLKLIEFSKVKSVGVVFDATTEDKYKRSANLVRHFSSLHKKVCAIAFTDSAILPPYVNNTLAFNYILKKDINWFNYPNNVFVNDFVKQEFDLLIDLDFTENKSIDYIVETSMAHCKIGLKRNSEIQLFDFMLEGIPVDDLNVFLKELLNYLELIKTK